ncbi:unnamed protein product [Sphagnum balticum]
MGKDRDLPFDPQKKKKSQFDDPRVCHYHLVAFCPHDLFPNTKSDLGPCEKIHDDGLRADFLNYNKVLQYEAEFLGYLERLIAELERKIRRSHERLEKEMLLTEHACANSDRISLIAMEVQSLLKQAEREGEDGLVDQAQATMDKVRRKWTKESDKLFQVAHRMVIVLLRKAGSGMGIGNTDAEVAHFHHSLDVDALKVLDCA